MNSRAILEIFVLFLAFNIILGQEFQFGQIYENSIRIDLPTHFSQNLAVGNNASLNATMRVSRTIHGIKLRSLENPGASADIIAGGIGYNFVTFMLRRNSNTLYFIAEAYENNTLGIETTTAVPTTPLPERVLQFWGVVNSGSVALNPKTYYSAASVPGHIAQRDVSISLSKVIHGIRVISYNDTAAEAVITDGGIGSNFTSIRVIGKASYLSFSVELFENGNAPTTPVQTTTNPTTIPTTPIPEKRVEEWGKFDDIARLDEKTFENYPPIWTTANDNVSILVNGIIYGIRLTSLNYTTGLYEIIAGGLEDNYVTFNFKGSRPGEPYNFNIEIYGNNAVNVKISIALFTMLVFVYNLLS